MTRDSTTAAPGKRTQRPSAIPSSGPPSDGMTICPTRTATCAGVAFVKRAEGAHVAFGDGEKQHLVARAAVHVLTVASPGRKSFTPRQEFPRAFRGRVTAPNPAKAADGKRMHTRD